jgi:SAM-dependent methyltransferase
MSDWWIFPPPSSCGHDNHKNNNHKNNKYGCYSKRQPVSFPYRVGDEVLVMVPQMKISNATVESAGSSSAADNQVLPNFAMITTTTSININISINNKNNNSTSCNNNTKQLPTILTGRVVQVKATEENSHHDVTINNKEVNIDTKNESTTITTSIDSSKTVVFVDVSASNNSLHRSGITPKTTPLLFNDKEQQRWLQPRFAVAKDESKSGVAVVLVQETAPFRQLIEFQLYQGNLGTNNNKDRVLEIGCSTGQLSQRIWKMGVGAWVGIDNSAEMVDTCSRQLQRYNIGIRSNYNILRIDPMLEPQRAYKETIKTLGGFPTVVCLDIGGNREIRPVLEVLSWVFRMFVFDSNSLDETNDELLDHKPLRLLLVKSRALVRSVLQDGANGKVRIDFPTGMISFGYDWFGSTLKRERPGAEVNRDDQRLSRHTLKRIRHPAKAPMAYSPTDGWTPICRYHNYHPKGCKKRNYAASPCVFDHEHCHACRQPGHIALHCTEESSRY